MNLLNMLQGLKGPDVMLLIVLLLSIPIGVALIVINMWRIEHRRQDRILARQARVDRESRNKLNRLND